MKLTDAAEVASDWPEAWDVALIPVAQAARLAPSVRVVRCAIRRGDLAADGAVSVEPLRNRMPCVPVVVVAPFVRRGSLPRDAAVKANP